MKPQLYTNDFDTFQSNAYLYRRGRIAFFQKHVRDGPNKPPLRVVAQISRGVSTFKDLFNDALIIDVRALGFQLCGIHQIYTLLDRAPILDPRLKQLVGAWGAL